MLASLPLFGIFSFGILLSILHNVIPFYCALVERTEEQKQAPARIIVTWLSLAGKKVDLIR